MINDGISSFNNGYITEPNTGCWLWTKYSDKDGYGSLTINRRPRSAHRFSYELYKGIIPNKLFVLHKCDTPSCVNPDHLFLGTGYDNVQDCKNKNRRANQRGENNPFSKLKEKQVDEIRLLLGSYKHPFIAKKYNVSRVTISNIANNKSWIIND